MLTNSNNSKNGIVDADDYVVDDEANDDNNVLEKKTVTLFSLLRKMI